MFTDATISTSYSAGASFSTNFYTVGVRSRRRNISLFAFCHLYQARLLQLQRLTMLLMQEDPEFGTYFMKFYCTPRRIPQWASWARQTATINVNMYLERFHRILKYLKRKQNNRVDDLVHILLDVAKDFWKIHRVSTILDMPSSNRLSSLHQQHRQSLKLQQSSLIQVAARNGLMFLLLLLLLTPTV